MVWLVVLMRYVMSQPGRSRVARSAGAVLRMLATPKLAVPAGMYLFWLAAVVWGAYRIGVWDSSLVKPTVLWVVFVSLPMYFGVTKALQQEDYFRKTLIALGERRRSPRPPCVQRITRAVRLTVTRGFTLLAQRFVGAWTVNPLVVGSSPTRGAPPSDGPPFRASRQDGDCDRCKQSGILTSEPLLASSAEVSALSD